MILLISSFVTNQRGYNRYSRFDIFKYMLHSYKDIPFSEIYLFILLDNEFIHNQENLTNYIYTTFSNLEKDKIHITYDRYYQQAQWMPFINQLVEKHGENELVWFTQNDDHIFVDFNMDILNEGLEILKNEPNKHKSIYFSHWPEIIRMSGKYQQPILVGNYVKFELSLLDSIQIFNLKFLYDIFIECKWKTDHIRIDTVLCDITSKVHDDNCLSHSIFVPLREMVRHFDGYDHVQMDRKACGPLVLPSNTFYYSKEVLKNKITAHHHSFWTKNNHFQIPQEWIDINLSLHPSNLLEHSVPEKLEPEIIFETQLFELDINNMTPISLGWNSFSAKYRANAFNRKKNNGYLTCPFDLCITPYLGLCKCILDDFDRNKFFNLRIEYNPINKQNCILNEYNMWFNHETEQKLNDNNVHWHPGKYMENDFTLFKERYEIRIQNFINYLNGTLPVLFIFNNPHDEPKYLVNILKFKYPELKFKILLFNNSEINLFYNQYMQSPDFPDKIYDYNYSYNFKNKFKEMNLLYKIHL